ncbi:PREDICTED: LOW QUALITY PROTEIN: hemogen [Miniopterus natalensis]|uniref:LOW QUALITY PROTEIN: hemogen n=1 Tax=Miniopterus natalensis TaxID=291302 RepID=UPI0007A6EFCA|nr:PREDICTED: LOW QUALITY PROTEIN: hemogen [Miniopterus natalensis]
MDLGRNQSHLTPHQKTDSHQEKNRVPEVIGTWSLRNREQLRKRKAEAQEKQTSQWQFGEKKYKRQRTGKGNQRGRKKQQNTELKMEPQSQLEKEMMEKALMPTEKENELPKSVTEALPLAASPQRVVPEKKFSAIGEESIIHQGNSSECQETTVQNHPSEIGQGMAEPEDLSPKMCQETSIVKALPSKTYEDITGMKGCSLEAYPKPDVPKDYAFETHQKRAEPKEDSTEPGQGIVGTESFLPKIQQEVAVPNDLSTKTYQDTVEPEHFSHKAYEEIDVPKTLSHKTFQETPAHEERPSEIYIYRETPGPEDCAPEIYEDTPGPEDCAPERYQETPYTDTPGPEDCAPERYQETPGPEDLSTKTYKNKNVPKECFPEPNQEADGPQGQDPKAHQEDAKDVYTFPREMKEKPKVEGPEIPAIPNVPQEIHPENDVYSYICFNNAQS